MNAVAETAVICDTVVTLSLVGAGVYAVRLLADRIRVVNPVKQAAAPVADAAPVPLAVVEDKAS